VTLLIHFSVHDTLLTLLFGAVILEQKWGVKQLTKKKNELTILFLLVAISLHYSAMKMKALFSVETLQSL
jgi:hypothetical protein